MKNFNHARFRLVFMNDFRQFLPFSTYLLTLNSSRSLLISLLHVFLGHALVKLQLTLNFQYLLGSVFHSTLSWRLNHRNLLFYKDSLMVFINSLFVSFTAEIVFSCLTLHIHPSIIFYMTWSLRFFHWPTLTHLFFYHSYRVGSSA